MQVKSGTERYSIAHLSVNDINQFFEAFNPNISVHIFHTGLYAFAQLVLNSFIFVALKFDSEMIL